MSAIKERMQIARIVKERPEQLKGFEVLAIDGPAGSVTGHQDDVDDRHLVVHAGGRFLGKDVVIEVDAIDEIDPEHKTIHVDRIVDWVKSSPKVGH